MSQILHAQPRIPAPIELIKEAVTGARESGIRVHVGDFGVTATSTHGPDHWELDPLAREPGCNAIGAVLLAFQPPAIDIPQAACQALGVSGCWLEAFCDGFQLEPKSPAWLASRQRDLYFSGYEGGCNFRIWLKSHPDTAVVQ
jgi:hypothetical protein